MSRLPGVAAGAALVGAWLLAAGGASGQAARLAGAAAAAAAGALLVRHVRRRLLGGPGGRPGAPDEFEVVWRRATERSRAPEPAERERLQRLVRLAVTDADHAHRRLRPLLRDLADARYESAHGLHPDRDPDAAERLGPAAWAWVRPDRPEPADRHGRGPDLDELEEVVAAVERIGGRPTGGGTGDPTGGGGGGR